MEPRQDNFMIEVLGPGQDRIHSQINVCQTNEHRHQVSYSTYHDAITQICWTERVIRTNSRELVTGVRS